MPLRSHRPPMFWLLLGLATCSSSSSGGESGGTSAGGGANQPGGQVGSGGASSHGGVTSNGGSQSGGASGAGGQTCPALPTAALASKDIIEFNDNGGWCWYQDERAVVDAKGGKFVIGSIASGGTRNSDQEVVIYDIASGANKRYTLQSDLNVDDHNAPAFVVNRDQTLGIVGTTVLLPPAIH